MKIPTWIIILLLVLVIVATHFIEQAYFYPEPVTIEVNNDSLLKVIQNKNDEISRYINQAAIYREKIEERKLTIGTLYKQLNEKNRIIDNYSKSDIRAFIDSVQRGLQLRHEGSLD